MQLYIKTDSPEVKARIGYTLSVKAVIFLGILLRLYHYLANRSLFGDEAYVAVNFFDRGFWDLTLPLEYGQRAPIGYLWAVKLVSLVAGCSEPSLRFVSLIAGIASLFLFYAWLNKHCPPGVILVALLLLALAEPLIYFSSEVKQYMLELVATLVVFLTCVPAREDSTGKLFIKAVTGGLLIWFSFPVIFVLAGVAITHILCYYRKRHLIPHLIVFTVWALSFGINFFLFVKSGTKDQFLLTFWKYHFMPLSPEIFRWGARLVYQTLNIPLGLSYSLIAVLALFAGIYSIWRRSRILSALCIFPCLLALIASALHLYPFHGRFLLFLVPIFLLWIAVGIMYCYDHLSHSANYAKIKILVLILLLAPPMVQAMYYLVYPDRFYYITRQEIRPVIQQMLKYHQAGDDIFVHQLATAQFRYYDKLLGITQQFDQANWVRPDSTATKPNVSQVIVQIFNASNLPEVSDHYMNKRSWFLFCRDKHDEEKHSLTFLNGNFRLLSKHKATRASIYLYQRR